VLDALLQRCHGGDRLALARLLTLIARGERLSEIRAGFPPTRARSRIVAVTGSAGVGKSTLVGKLLTHIRGEALTVAVLACDPQSPLTGGALLGDRFRMPTQPDDDGVFIRSLAAIGGHGAVAQHVDTMLQALEAFGFQVIVLETVGAGQGDTVVRDLADVVVLLLQPETGDDLQWEKAGVLEVADVVVIHKADMPGADRLEAQVRAVLELAGQPKVPVLRVSSHTGEGIDGLWKAVAECPSRRKAEIDGQWLLGIARDRLAEHLRPTGKAPAAPIQELVQQIEHGKITEDEAVRSLFRYLADAF
jgi:LAO/AO transport system ATPase